MNPVEIAALVALSLVLIVRQLRSQPFGVPMFIVPVGLAAWLGGSYVVGAPTLGNDMTLYVIAGLVGGGVGLMGGLLSRVYRDQGRIMVRGGAAYAVLFGALIAARLGFAWAVNNGWQDQVARFCVTYKITGEAPIVAAMMLMLVGTVAVRSAVIALRAALVSGHANSVSFANVG